MASFTWFSFVFGSVLSMLFFGTCYGQIKGQMSELAETAQLLQGAMTKIEDLENIMKVEQDKMTDQMDSLLTSIGSGLVTKFTSEMESFHGELTKALNPQEGESKIGRIIDEMGEELWNTYREIRKLRNLFEDHNTNCPKAWTSFDDSCYFISFYVGNWTASRDHCKEMGGDLVKISTEKEYKFLWDRVEGNTWIGLTDQEEEGDFKWSLDNTNYNISSSESWWHKDQPDDYKGNEDCVIFWFTPQGIKLNDAGCHHRMQYVCEKKTLTNVA